MSKHFLNIVSDGELEEKEVSIMSNELFKEDINLVRNPH